MLDKDFRYKWWALIGLSLLSFTAFLDYTIVTTALPTIQRALGASVLQLQWVINIFTMILCMFMIIVGQLGDRFGHRRIFYVGFIIFAIAAFGAGSATNIETLIFFRGIQGFAGAIIFTIGVALLPHAFPQHEQHKAIGVFSAFNGAGLAAGPFIGGTLITLLSWRWIFWINIPIILVGIIFCSFSLRSSPKSTARSKIDWLGFFLLAVGLGSLIYGLIYGAQIGWEHSKPIAIIVTGIIALVILFAVEKRIKHPLLDLSIFSRYATLLAILICIGAGLVTGVLFFFDPLYLQVIRGYTPFYVGLIILIIPAVQVFISLILGPLIKAFGILNLIIFGLFTGLLTCICHAFFTVDISIYFIFFAFILMGYSWGIANAGTIAAANLVTPPEKLGSVIGTIFTFWNISGSIFLAIASVVFHWQEDRMIHRIIQDNNISLSAIEQRELHSLLANPEQLNNFFIQYPQVNATELISAFNESFISGLHLVAWCSAVVFLIICMYALMKRKR